MLCKAREGARHGEAKSCASTHLAMHTERENFIAYAGLRRGCSLCTATNTAIRSSHAEVLVGAPPASTLSSSFRASLAPPQRHVKPAAATTATNAAAGSGRACAACRLSLMIIRSRNLSGHMTRAHDLTHVVISGTHLGCVMT